MQYALIFCDLQLILAPMPPPPRRCLRHEAAAVTSTPPSIAVPIVPGARVAGSGWALARRTVIPAVDRGAHGLARAVEAFSKRPTAHRCMANASRPTCWYGPWARGRKAGASALSPGASRWPRTRRCQWVVEVADHATACARYFWHGVRVTQVPLDALCALLRAVQAGAVSEAEAITRLSRSPHWGWTAMEPGTKRL